MGWYYTIGGTRRSLIAELTKSQPGRTCLRHCLRGNILWAVREDQSGKFITCDRLMPSKDGWGHKPLDESMGPIYYTCPLSYLDETLPINESWRANVRNYHARHRRASAA